MPDPETDLGDVIQDVAANPQSVTTDGQTFSEHSLPDLIEADRYQKAQKAAAAASAKTGKKASGFSFLRPAKAVPPGS